MAAQRVCCGMEAQIAEAKHPVDNQLHLHPTIGCGQQRCSNLRAAFIHGIEIRARADAALRAGNQPQAHLHGFSARFQNGSAVHIG